MRPKPHTGLALCDLSLPTPEENLACDEALLHCAENGHVGPCLRFWEPHQTFVVLGYGNRADTEADIANCQRQGIPILRRCTGGGAVLQARGVLNYSLVLATDPPFDSITGANRTIMERHAATLSTACGKSVTVEGHTDLAIGGRKISGNAQRRCKNFLLFHGSILLGLDFSLVGEALRLPIRQPCYRRQRSHQDFLLNLELAPADVKTALLKTWNASEPLMFDAGAATRDLVRSRYSQRSWNYKF